VHRTCHNLVCIDELKTNWQSSKPSLLVLNKLGPARDETYRSRKIETNKCEKQRGERKGNKKPNRKRGER
jgi:hypothetical protein